jgi:hypothetical protein
MRSVTIVSMWRRATTYTMFDNSFLGSLDRPGLAIYYIKEKSCTQPFVWLGAFVLAEKIFLFSSYNLKIDYYYQ